jgi:branched-chain amino acid transport system substrate-binding protein
MSHRRLLLALVSVLALAACGEQASRQDSAPSPSRDGGSTANTPACGPVEYGGEGRPDAVIASDLPMQGAARTRSDQMVEAIRLELERRDWRAGSLRIGFKPCDDSLAKTGEWDQGRCEANARAYARDRRLLGVVGTYNSGCAEAMLPILSRAPGGPVAMVSPGNTLVCLTKTSVSCEEGAPGRYYPGGKRNYARVVPNDADQGAGLASFADQRKLRRVYVLQARDDPTSAGQARAFTQAARELGIRIAGEGSWDPKAHDYRRLMEEVNAARPQAVILAGLTEQNGGQLIRDKVGVVGRNDRVALLAQDGFAQQSSITEAGAASRGMLATTPGRSPDALSGLGRRFVEDLRARVGDRPLELYAPYAGQAAALLLDAIARSGEDRARVAEALRGMQVKDGIVGDFSIDEAGDTTLRAITVSRAGKEFHPIDEVNPPASLVVKARR